MLKIENFSELAKPEEYKKGLFLEVQGQMRKLSQVPKPDGTTEEVYIPWSLATINRHYGKDFTAKVILEEIPKLDGEIIVPEHINFQQIIGRFLNTYHPIQWKPQEGADWEHIRELFQHIFGVQYELGLDYFQLLYLYPKQRLPLLLLVAQENNTGKSTFCDFLKAVFGANATGMSSEGLRSRFTSTWMNKLIVTVEEKLLDREGDCELIKNLVTTFTAQSEAKGKDRVEVPFFAKFVMTTNNEDNPLILHEDDTRVWAIRVPTLGERKEKKPNFLEDCKKEIPYFLHYISTRQLTTRQEDRLWFRRELVETEQWLHIVNFCRSNIEKQLAISIIELMELLDVQQLRYSPKNLVELLRNEGIRTDKVAILQLLKKRWKLQPGPKQKYYKYFPADNQQGYMSTYTSGYPYVFDKEFLQKFTI